MSDLIHETTEEAQHTSRSCGMIGAIAVAIIIVCSVAAMLITQVQNYTAADLWARLVGG